MHFAFSSGKTLALVLIACGSLASCASGSDDDPADPGWNDTSTDASTDKSTADHSDDSTAGKGGASGGGAGGSAGEAGGSAGEAGSAGSGGSGGSAGSAGTAGSGGAAGSGGTGGSGGSGGTGGSGGSGGTGGSSGTGGSGGTACEYWGNACGSAVSIGTISGDNGAETLNANGQTSRWLLFRITENNNWDSNLSATVVLTSPDAMNYDLAVYEKCGGGMYGSSSNGPGQPDSVSLSVTDGWGTTDDRDILVEVKYKTGSQCGAAAKWNVLVTGNTK